MVLDANGRILSVADEGYHCGPGEVLREVPEAFTFDAARDWVLTDGAWVIDPLPAPALDTSPTLQEQIDALSAAVLELALGGGASV